MRTGCGAKMAEALALEKTDEHSHPVKRLLAHSSGKPQKAMKQHANMAEMAASSDDEDHDYEELKSASSPSSDSGDDMLSSNAEVCCLVILSFCSSNMMDSLL
jgi:hypothetical protein